MADGASATSAAGIPPCKGCGSTNLRAISWARVCSKYDNPTHVEDGNLHFAFSYTGQGENERWSIECGDCGRRMRTNLAPVNDD